MFKFYFIAAVLFLSPSPAWVQERTETLRLLGEQIGDTHIEFEEVDKIPRTLKNYNDHRTAKYSNRILELGLSLSKIPDNDGFALDWDTPFGEAVQVIAKHAVYSDKARYRLYQLIEDDCFYYVIKGLSKYPNVLEKIKPELIKLLFEILDIPEKTSVISRTEKYVFISKQKLINEKYISVLIKNLTYKMSNFEAYNLVYAFNGFDTLNEEARFFLEVLISVDIEQKIIDLKKTYDRHRKHLRLLFSSAGVPEDKNRASLITVANNIMPDGEAAADISPLYAAAILLKHDKNHHAAKIVLEKYLTAGLKLLSVDRDFDYADFQSSSKNYPGFIYVNQDFDAVYVNISPLEGLYYGYGPNNDEFKQILLEELTSVSKARSINAARLIINKNIKPNEDMLEVLLDKAATNYGGRGFNYYVLTLKNAKPTKAVTDVLKEIVKERDPNRRKYSQEVLDYYKTLK